MTEHADLVVIGAGIVGLATARAVLRDHPNARVVVIEKESLISGHQSGRNSGVIHAGAYYAPGSEKARLCTAGRASMVAYCEARGIAHGVCGKVVVAIDAEEDHRLRDLEQRCRENGVSVKAVGPAGLRDIEPHAAGFSALHVLATGITDYAAVCASLAAEITDAGGRLQLGTSVISGTERAEGLILETEGEPIRAGRVVACAGLHADRIAEAVSGPGAAGGLQIIPFRGEYHELTASRKHLVRHLIYPVPDPRFPFLGVHLTRGVDGHVHVGPNAVLALAREGYRWRDIDRRDLRETLGFSGFRRLAAKYWRYGAGEMARSLSRRRFTHALQRLVPEVRVADLEPSTAGVRAQAVAPDGNLVDDFAFRQIGRALHVLNAPSPAATASLEIGAAISRRLELEGVG